MEHRGTPELTDLEAGEGAIQAFGGLAVVVLAILGLSGLAPAMLASIAGIVIGAALLAEGGTIAGELSILASGPIHGGASGAEAGSGMTVEFLAGGAVVVLGILALIGLSQPILVPALIIVTGTALILTTGTMHRLDEVKMEASGTTGDAQRIVRGAASGTAGAQLLAGLAAIVLGILALVSSPAGTAGPAAGNAANAGAAGGSTWIILTLVALLVLGTALAINRATLAGRLVRLFNHRHQTI
jgi:hypothetical protein